MVRTKGSREVPTLTLSTANCGKRANRRFPHTTKAMRTRLSDYIIATEANEARYLAYKKKHPTLRDPWTSRRAGLCQYVVAFTDPPRYGKGYGRPSAAGKAVAMKIPLAVEYKGRAPYQRKGCSAASRKCGKICLLKTKKCWI